MLLSKSDLNNNHELFTNLKIAEISHTIDSDIRDLNSVKDLLGHTSLAATQVYTNRSIEEIKKVFKKSHPRNKG